MGSQGKAMVLGGVVLLLVLGVGPAAVYGEATFGFTSVSATTATDALIGESQFFMDVLDESARQVLFTIRNTGPQASSITGVFLEDRGGIFEPVFSSVSPRTVAGSGVVFARSSVAVDLLVLEPFEPFATTPELSVTAVAPVLTNGINPGESLDVVANLTDDIVTAQMMDRLEAGTVRVALLAQGFPDGGTATFINNTSPVVTPTPTPTPTPTAIPAPGAVLLGALGAGLVGWLRRRQALA